jgi:hypothetical protein
MDTLLGLFVGIGLSAACGFRIFVPMMGLSIAALSGQLTLAPGLEWIGTWPALIAFIIATGLEIGAYYIPWFDNMMDALTTPAAIVAGTIIVASMAGDVSPFLRWSLAIIAGGGVAAIVQGGTVALRAGSSATTAGMSNFLVSSVELAGSTLLTIFAILLPVLCFAAVLWICYKMITKIAKSTFIRGLFRTAAGHNKR